MLRFFVRRPCAGQCADATRWIWWWMWLGHLRLCSECPAAWCFKNGPNCSLRTANWGENQCICASQESLVSGGEPIHSQREVPTSTMQWTGPYPTWSPWRDGGLLRLPARVWHSLTGALWPFRRPCKLRLGGGGKGGDLLAADVLECHAVGSSAEWRLWAGPGHWWPGIWAPTPGPMTPRLAGNIRPGERLGCSRWKGTRMGWYKNPLERYDSPKVHTVVAHRFERRRNLHLSGGERWSKLHIHISNVQVSLSCRPGRWYWPDASVQFINALVERLETWRSPFDWRSLLCRGYYRVGFLSGIMFETLGSQVPWWQFQGTMSMAPPKPSRATMSAIPCRIFNQGPRTPTIGAATSDRCMSWDWIRMPVPKQGAINTGGYGSIPMKTPFLVGYSHP